ncbi:hypothetical protein HPB50_020588 [Hyalomma asiaticum]|uniref:Uncharacterized protein n=1 Tax=Hyalomma asiaticum TaxID=266040 RepID=A0ACB7SRW3_HYAAI|nr:hypothetical protein HPB50_020588 [Hyalomma asiaticum]
MRLHAQSVGGGGGERAEGENIAQQEPGALLKESAEREQSAKAKPNNSKIVAESRGHDEGRSKRRLDELASAAVMTSRNSRLVEPCHDYRFAKLLHRSPKKAEQHIVAVLSF